MKRMTQTAFPEHPQAVITSLAWRKLIAALPPNFQHTLSLLPQQSPNEEALETLDNAWRLQTQAQGATARVATSQNKEVEILEALSAISNRLDHLEQKVSISAAARRGSPPNSSINHYHAAHPPDICWYHQKFGQRAQRCLHPCKFHKSGAAKSNGAPSP
jgi:hypothetical protein